MPHPEPQTYQGHLKSMATLPYGNQGKSMLKFTVTHKKKKKVGEKMEIQDVDVEFTAFGVMAEKLEIGFKPGRVVIIRYELGNRANGQFMNTTTEIQDIDIYDQVAEVVEFMKNLSYKKNNDPGAYRPPTAQQQPSLPMNQPARSTPKPKSSDDDTNENIPF